MYQGIRLTNSSSVAELKSAHLKTLTAPLDAYWEEALIGFADHFELRLNGIQSGYYCLNHDRQLVAFYLSQPARSQSTAAFQWLLNQHQTTEALAGTNDPLFSSLCQNLATQSQIHTLLFATHAEAQPFPVQQSFSFRLANEADFESVLEHYGAASGALDSDSVETGFGDLKKYLRSVMNEHHIFVLRNQDELLATSECRISKTQIPFADIGMIVAESHRRKGLGSQILARTRDYCLEQNLRPICSCEANNIGSHKAITRAGFICEHQIRLYQLTTQTPFSS